MLTRFLVACGLVIAIGSGATAQVWNANLDGTQESPSFATPGFGAGTTSYDPGTSMLTVSLQFSGLLGTTTDSHIHCCFSPGNRNAGVAVGFTSTGFPLGVTSGSYTHTFDLLNPAIYNGSFFNNAGGGTAVGARNALLAGMNAGTSYLNIHSTARASGEIRGDLSLVPEPSTWALLIAGASVGAVRLRKRLVRAA